MRSSAPIGRQAMAFVLAGGRGSRLVELTDRRAKPAVYFGGKMRIIDFALSNALNSGIRRIGVATQYKAHSLIRHLQRGWNFFRPERNEGFDILPALLQTLPSSVWMGRTRGRGAGHVGVQGAPLRGRDRALGGPVVLPVWDKLSRSRADDGGARRL